ncbi:STAS domain-containing protein [Micromonospora sp. U21]|uniref:STAS domain-containing protein n=1 Tax=Micromonospora sp. U21 TaxID=2824899 RepID=UPI001B365010|nr:STAS domain-containing protein [Micromonospora sp. U21]MBQ0902548.1 STAS domain-containing protein [Micromonospora sp. U21]
MTGPPAPTPCTLPLVEVCVTELDRACLPAAGAVFDRLLALHPTQVVVDLSRCRHIDAAAIGLLLDVHRRLARAGGVLTIRNPNPRIRRILHTARLDQVLPIVTDPPPSASGAPTPGQEPASAQPALVAYGRAPVATSQ